MAACLPADRRVASRGPSRLSTTAAFPEMSSINRFIELVLCMSQCRGGSGTFRDESTDKQTNTRRTRLYLLVENWQFTQYRRKESIPRLPLPPLPPLQSPPTQKRPRREPSNSVTGTGGVLAPPEPCKPLTSTIRNQNE